MIIREVSQLHVRVIKLYILENVLEEQIYFHIVAHLEKGSLENGLNGVLTIIDGSHRLKAFLQLEEILLKLINSEKEVEMKRGYRHLYLFENTSLSLQIFEGFTL